MTTCRWVSAMLCLFRVAGVRSAEDAPSPVGRFRRVVAGCRVVPSPGLCLLIWSGESFRGDIDHRQRQVVEGAGEGAITHGWHWSVVAERDLHPLLERGADGNIDR